MGRYSVYYFYTPDGLEPQFVYAPLLRGFILYNPSESVMFIPGTYAQMLEDYE